MNDYKKLIVKCDYWINLGDEIDKKLAVTKFMEECRDAIEQLVKERDAAVDDLKKNRVCTVCALGHDDTLLPCEECCSYTDNRFEWRGVRSETDVR